MGLQEELAYQHEAELELNRMKEIDIMEHGTFPYNPLPDKEMQCDADCVYLRIFDNPTDRGPEQISECQHRNWDGECPLGKE